jgi:hypothetical protein
MLQPDFVLETFEPGTETGGSDAGRRGLRYLEWRWVPESSHETYLTDMARGSDVNDPRPSAQTAVEALPPAARARSGWLLLAPWGGPGTGTERG